MSLTQTEIGNVALACDAQRCGEILVSTASQADVLATARAGRWYVGTSLHFCDRHAYLGALANPGASNNTLRSRYGVALAAGDASTMTTLRNELVARGAVDQVGPTTFLRRRPSGGRGTFAFFGTDGSVVETQPHIATTNWMAQRPAPNISGTVSLGPVVSAIGTATAATVASATTDIAGQPRTSYISAAGAGSSGGLRSTSAYIQRSNGAGRGGFIMICRFAFASIPATRRWFVGLSPTLTNTEPSSWLTMMGVGQDLADTSPQFMHNDGSGTATKTSSGLADVAVNLIYEVRLLSAPNLTTVQMSVERFAAGASAEYAEYDSGVSTDLPAQITVTQWAFWANNGSTAAVIDPVLIDLYFETY